MKALQEDHSALSFFFRLRHNGKNRIHLATGLLPILLVALAAAPLRAQAPSRITAAVDLSQTHALQHHRPAWASAENDQGPVAAGLKLDSMTLVLQRSPQQEAALTQLLADQQNPASPEFHHWLTPDEMGLRFGLSESDIAAISSWLQSQNLHVNWIAPNRTFIGFGGAAADVNRAFQTELHTYAVDGESRYAVNSDPTVPAAIAPAILAIRGLSTPTERPQSSVSVLQSDSPQMTYTYQGTVYHVIAPADFDTIYTGAGYTIGIVGWMPVSTTDLDEFRTRTGATFPNPTVVVPTAYGGKTPDAACTSTTCSTADTSAQGEATLDVIRAGSTAPGASLELVVSTSAGTGTPAPDGLAADAQYLINTTPLVNVMSISFGGCEIGSASDVTYWNTIFQTAAGEGISSFVASDDSGAAGCDTPFKAPPVAGQQQANSPNAICSSSYATCVGGTEFNDTASPSTYWNSTSSGTLESALSYIPEGAWNESTTSSIAASGGGVSQYIATPSWQTGTGVPSTRSGRYTPDVAFSAAGHDGYFACMAADGGSCVGTSSYGFVVFSGTSAAAPSMAGIAALLDQKLNGAQGSLNPGLYALASSVPAAFHTVDVSTSGVGTCTLSAVSMCDNTVPAASGTQQGYKIGTTQSYNEVTGLGSLDVATFLNDYSSSTVPAPAATTAAATNIAPSTATLNATVNPNGADTHYWFLYGASSTLSGATQTASVDIGSGTTAAAVSAPITGLSASTIYYFQVVAQNSTGTTSGAILSFTSAPPAPIAVTGSASSITTSAATVSATVNPNGADTHVWFLWGTSPTLAGAAQTSSVDIGSGSTAAAASANLTGLSASTTYYFQVVAQSGSGTSHGIINSFTTPASGTTSSPSATTTAATSVAATTATLNASVNPNGSDTHVVFLWGTSSSLSSSTSTTSQDIGSGSTASAITAPLTGLTASTTYYFQVMAQNGSGTTSGSIQSFTTTPPATFTLSGTAPATVVQGGSSSSTITLTSEYGFSGAVTLSAALNSYPSGGNNSYEPTFSFSPSNTPTLTSGGTQQVTLNFGTSAPVVSALHRPALPTGLHGYGEGGAVLACLLLFGLPARRRRWLSMLGLAVLFAALSGGLTACGSGGSGGGGGTTTTGGTTIGSYTYTVTGTVGSTAVTTTTVTLTVN